MSRLYYILAITVKSDDTWGKFELVFVGFQWLLFIGCPLLALENLSASGKINWYKHYEVKPYFLLASLILICLNHFLFFRKKQTAKIIDKYAGKYPLIDKYPIGAYFLFHLIMPIILFVLVLFLIRVLNHK